MRMNRDHHFATRWPRGGLHIRAPQATDGPQIWRLVKAAEVLDANSLYCNLLQCSHFAETCALAEHDNEIVGWMSGYVPPAQPDTLFVWQVCVSDAARGQGLGHSLITSVLERPDCAGVRHVECTITKENTASWALFRKVAGALDTDMTSQPHFLRATHLDGRHDSEMRVIIGPFDPTGARLAMTA